LQRQLSLEASKDSGADPTEVSDDLRRRVDEEIASTGLHLVTERDVRTILMRIGAPEPAGNAATRDQDDRVALRSRAKSPGHYGLLFWGVILPIITIGLEVGTHMCAGVFFDPIPTWWHVMLVCTVPLINFLTWAAIRQEKETWTKPLGWATGFAIAISGFYALLYLPLVPMAVLGVFFLGFGLLPLTPLLSFIGACSLRRLLSTQVRQTPFARLTGLWRGTSLGALAIMLIAIPTIATRYLAALAASDSEQTRTVAVKWLRAIGSQRVLLADCYGATSWSRNSALGFIVGQPLAAEEARAVFFRVTGKPFNSLPAPQQNYARGGWDLLDDLEWDSERGGETVAGRVKGLSLSQSRMDGLFDPDAAWSYVEWIMEFKNSAQGPREARAQIALPPGGCVSRLTLWVNGEEREAAFAGSSQVREAYQTVAIARRRDPVLVTSCGLDRVMMQCFPVPAHGTMKVRVGITSPAALASSSQALSSLPAFLERNFSVPAEVKHSIWVESDQLLSSSNELLKQHRAEAERFGLSGDIPDMDLGSARSTIMAARSADHDRSWVVDHAISDGSIVWQRVETAQNWKPERIVFVLDGTAGMTEAYRQLAQTLSHLPAEADIAVVHASDALQIFPAQPSRAAAVQLSSKIPSLHARGGQDNVPALLAGWDLAAAKERSAVIWVHGPQPILLGKFEALKQRLDWCSSHSNVPRVFDFPTRPGPNRVLEKVDGTSPFISVIRHGSLNEDIERLFRKWGEEKSLQVVRNHAANTNAVAGTLGKHCSKHLTRLWAYEEVLKKISAKKTSDALALAARYQLVTPVSGAVVLETAAQFASAGLKAIDPNSAPSVPEPSVIAIVALAAFVLFVVRPRWLKRKNASLAATDSQISHH